MPRFAGIVFDFDGTIAALTIDFEHMRRRVEEILARYGLAEEQGGARYVLERIEDACQRYAAQGGDARALRRELFCAVEEIELAAAAQGRLLPGAAQTLAELRQLGLRLGIVTRNCAAAVRAVFPEIGEACHVLVTRDDVRQPKPHPEHVQRCLALLGVAPQRALMVGDHPVDVISGRRLGMATAAVLTGSGTAEQFRDAGADWILADVRGVLQLVQGEDAP